MFRPYTNAAGQAAHRKSKADTAQQEQWLANANNGGPLPIHEPHQKTAIFDVRDNDPSAAVLTLAQKQLAAANRTRSLLTFEGTPQTGLTSSSQSRRFFCSRLSH